MIVIILRDLLDQFAAFLVCSLVLLVLDKLCNIKMLDFKALFVKFVSSHLG
jgi:hypothetical protein